MDRHLRFDTRPPLERPTLLCAFEGWNDGGEAASVAARYLAERWLAEPFGWIDAEEFYDFQVNRPSVRQDGAGRVIGWPHPTLAAAQAAGRSVVFLTAPEPNVRWRTFGETVIDACRELRVETLVTFGAFLTDVPHARAVPIVGSARDRAEAEMLDLSSSTYEGPTGIVGVLNDAASRAGIASVSFWAAVPHYLPAAPNPKAALALVERAAALIGAPVDTEGLERTVDTWERDIARVLEENEELSEYADRLADSVGSEDAPGAEDDRPMRDEPIPSGDAIAAEFERFLREQAPDDPGSVA